jgi:hypothetical protein
MAKVHFTSPDEAIYPLIHIQFYHRANNLSKCADGFHDYIIDNKDGHIPAPLIMSTFTGLHHALLECQKNIGVHLTASKSKLKADRPNRNPTTRQKSGQKDSGTITQQEREQSKNRLRQSIFNVKLTQDRALLHLLDNRWRARTRIHSGECIRIKAWQETPLTQCVGQQAPDDEDLTGLSHSIDD